MATIHGGEYQDYNIGLHQHDTIFGGHDDTIAINGHGEGDLRGGAYDEVFIGGHGTGHLFGGHDDDINVHDHGSVDLQGGHDDALSISGHGTASLFGGHDDDISVTDHGKVSIQGGHDDTIDVSGHGVAYVQGGVNDDFHASGSGKIYVEDSQGKLTDVITSAGDQHFSHPAALVTEETFNFNGGGGQTVTLDLTHGEVVAIAKNINGLSLNNTHDLMSHISDHGGHITVDLGQGDSLVLHGVSAADVLHHPDTYFKLV
jgi:hypothetical protein